MGKEIKIKNTLKGNIVIREGNAGVYRKLSTIESKRDYKLEIDPNATYREYVLITLPDNTELPPFSSDDIVEFKEIVVKERENVDGIEASAFQKYYWEGDPIDEQLATTPSNSEASRSYPEASPSNPGPVAPVKLGLGKKIKAFFTVRKN